MCLHISDAWIMGVFVQIDQRAALADYIDHFLSYTLFAILSTYMLGHFAAFYPVYIEQFQPAKLSVNNVIHSRNHPRC